VGDGVESVEAGAEYAEAQGASTAGLTVGDASKQHLATSRHQVCVTKCNKPHSSYKWRRTRALSGFQAMSAPQLIAQPSQPPHKSFTTALRDGRESVEEEAVRAEAQAEAVVRDGRVRVEAHTEHAAARVEAGLRGGRLPPTLASATSHELRARGRASERERESEREKARGRESERERVKVEAGSAEGLVEAVLRSVRRVLAASATSNELRARGRESARERVEVEAGSAEGQ